MTEEEVREHTDMLIAHKDKALETHPYFKRCDSCIHSEEQDGSNCYECIKGMGDNFEAQPKTSFISIDVNKLAKEVAEKVLDEITYEGKTIREWAEILVKQQPSEDCISRQAAINTAISAADDWDGGCDAYREEMIREALEAMPSVYPERPKGKWMATENEDMNIVGYYCSCCDLPMETEEKTKYCPNCGAEMSGGGDE